MSIKVNRANLTSPDEFRKMSEAVRKIPVYVWERPIAESNGFRFAMMHLCMTGRGRTGSPLNSFDIEWYEKEKRQFANNDDLEWFVKDVCERERVERKQFQDRIMRYKGNSNEVF